MKLVRPYCRTIFTFQTNTARCDQDLVPKLWDHIVEPIRLLKQKKYCAIIISYQFHVWKWNRLKSEMCNWCDHIVAPISRFKQKQQGATKISSQNCATKLSHQFVFWNKNITVWLYCRTKSTFGTKTAKKRDLNLVRPYCRTNATFSTKTRRRDQDRVPKLCDHIVAPIRLLKQNHYCVIIWLHRFHVWN